MPGQRTHEEPSDSGTEGETQCRSQGHEGQRTAEMLGWEQLDAYHRRHCGEGGGTHALHHPGCHQRGQGRRHRTGEGTDGEDGEPRKEHLADVPGIGDPAERQEEPRQHKEVADGHP